jgi:hypothetical protein
MDPNVMAIVDRRLRELDKQADRRKGEIPEDQFSPKELVEMHMAYIAKADMMTGIYRFLTMHQQAPYPPCTRPAAELKPIKISDLRVGTHHRGCRILVRILTPPARVFPVVAIVGDEEGAATMLQFYHAPSEAVVPTSETLRMWSYYLIKEPYFKWLDKLVDQSVYTLRVDHASDIMLLRVGDELLPARCREPLAPIHTSKDIRMKGNAAVEKKSWAEAERL